VDRRAARALLVAAITSATCLAAPAAQAAPGFASADRAAITPGALMTTPYGEDASICTAGFVFAGGASVYLGYAAHCAGHGDPSGLSGCVASTLPLGSPVIIKGRDGRERVGRLAYSSWLTMQERGENDEARCFVNDFALVEIADGDAADVNPTVPVFGGPDGVNTTGLSTGSTVYSYQNSPLRLGISALSPKVGLVAQEAGGGRSHVVYTVTPGIPGDSGSGFMDGSGKAVGVLSTLNIAPVAASNGVADLGKALAYANANGGVGKIAIANGTEPFSPNPVGVAGDLLKLPQL
jgi:hypothetical protein